MATLVWTKVQGQEKYRALSRRLREAGQRGLQRELTRAIRKEGDGALRAVKAAWMTVDVQSSRGGGESSGLRGRVAAATRISVLQSGIRIRVESSRVDPAYGRALSFGLDGLGRWRHPVFGNPKVWESQKGQEVFYKTLERYEPRWRAGIERAMEDIARQIEG
jgi:hypothetical protein